MYIHRNYGEAREVWGDRIANSLWRGRDRRLPREKTKAVATKEEDKYLSSKPLLNSQRTQMTLDAIVERSTSGNR